MDIGYIRHDFMDSDAFTRWVNFMYRNFNKLILKNSPTNYLLEHVERMSSYTFFGINFNNH